MSDDEYKCVSKGKLKLKTDSKVKKSKKSRRKERDSLQRAVTETPVEDATDVGNSGRQMTKAEQAFQQQQEKMRNKRIMEKASVTHKQRVEKFNQDLDSLSEHYDIPKVSWTK